MASPHRPALTLAGLAVLGAAGAAYGLFEAQHVGLRSIDAPVRGLPRTLDGVRVLHLSDLHLGTPGVSARAARRAVELVRGASPDLICVSGDIRSHERGDAAARAILASLAELAPTFVSRGNHDAAITKDPFAGDEPFTDVDGTGAVLLDGTATTLALRGVPIAIAGVRPEDWEDDPEAACAVVDAMADVPLRILVCHYPEAIDHAAGRVGLILAGHLHGGQLVVPYPGGRLRLACPTATYPEGSWGRDGTLLHVTRGVGTTFVPFRVLARPEVSLLRLRTT